MAYKKNSENYPAWTPYGKSQFRKNFCRAVVFLSVGKKAMYRVDTEMYFDACKEQGIPTRSFERNDDGKYMWFEQKKQWGFIALSFPDLLERYGKFFPGKSLAEAEKNVLDYTPEYWEFWKNSVVLKGMSKVRDLEIFKKEHPNELLVLKTVPLHDMVKLSLVASAFRGGEGKRAEARFLIPVEKCIRSAVNGKQQGYTCSVPYIIQEEDKEISCAVLTETRDALDAYRENAKDCLFPEKAKINGDIIELICTTLDGERKEHCPVSINDWEARDMMLPCHLEMKNGGWHLVEEISVRQTATPHL